MQRVLFGLGLTSNCMLTAPGRPLSNPSAKATAHSNAAVAPEKTGGPSLGEIKAALASYGHVHKQETSIATPEDASNQRYHVHIDQRRRLQGKLRNSLRGCDNRQPQQLTRKSHRRNNCREF